jgi:23S rRNA pseudouridine1911/1915/1917 synthase
VDYHGGEDWHEFPYSGTSGERCDAALTLHLREMPEFAEVSRARIQTLIEMGGVLINGREVYSAQKCRPNIVISANLALLRWLLKPLAVADIEPVDLHLTVHYMDEHLAVVEKPAGISVHPSPTDSGPTLAAALLHEFGKLSDAGGTDRPGIVHRLDKETTGLLVVARDNPTHVALQRQFASRLVEKLYLALCINAPEHKTGRIDLPIERHPYDRKRMWARGQGKPAQTEYETAEYWGPLTLLRVAIHTGRTHQIRVHLQEAAGVALVNDYKYGQQLNTAMRNFLKRNVPRGLPQEWDGALPDLPTRKRLLEVLEGYSGIFLHAHELRFVHPGTQEPMHFVSPPPPVWDAVRKLVDEQADSS